MPLRKRALSAARTSDESHAAVTGLKHYRPGPSTLGGVLEVVPDGVRHMMDRCPQDLKGHSQAKLSEGWVVSSWFSGTGGFEAVAVQVAGVLRDVLQIDGKVVCYFATENWAGAQQALLGHSEESRPLHMFVDVLDRLFDVDRWRLQSAVEQKLEALQCAKVELALGHYTKPEFEQEKKTLEAQLVAFLLDAFKSIEFQERAYCMACDAQCPLSPRSDPEFSGCFWTEASGSVCTSWSSFGSNGQWLSINTLSTLVWFHSTKFYEPDLVLHESSPNFDYTLMRRLFCDVDLEVPRSIYARPLAGEEAQHPHAYKSEVLVFCPTSLGVLSLHRRKYAAVHLEPSPLWTRACHSPNCSSGNLGRTAPSTWSQMRSSCSWRRRSSSGAQHRAPSFARWRPLERTH